MPTLMPKEYEKTSFIRGLPIGSCLVGDRSDSTSRAFAITVRPRFSQHEGREARSVSFEEGIKPEEVRRTMIKIVKKRVEDFKRVHVNQVDEMVRTINHRYKVQIDPKELVEEMTRGEYALDGDYVVNKSEIGKQEEEQAEEEELAPESEAFLSLRGRISEEDARRTAESKRGKKTLGLFGEEEALKKFGTEYTPVYKVEYDYFEGKGFRRSQCYVDGTTGEILSSARGELASTTGVKRLLAMPPEKRKVIVALKKGKRASVKSLAMFSGLSEKDTLKESDDLVRENVFGKDKNGIYSLKERFSLPEKLVVPDFTSLESAMVMEEKTGLTVKPLIQRESVEDVPALFGEVKIRNVSFVYRPIYHAVFSSSKGSREIEIDAMNGRVKT
jgi:hypothetical protein